MKIIFGLITFFVSVVMFSQQEMVKDVDSFYEVKVYDLISVKLVPSEENKVIVSGENTENVKIINDRGSLKVRMELEERFDGKATFVNIYYNSIMAMDANEGAEISSDSLVKESSLELRTQEGGKIRLNIESDSLTIKAVSGGKIHLSGTSGKQNININTGGIYEGKDLQTSSTEVTVTAGGSAEIYAIDKVDAKVTAGGTVDIYGNPKELQKKKFAGGKINIKEIP